MNVGFIESVLVFPLWKNYGILMVLRTYLLPRSSYPCFHTAVMRNLISYYLCKVQDVLNRPVTKLGEVSHKSHMRDDLR